jgi:hypothetical protein
MAHIYCVVNDGNSLPFEISDFLLWMAHDLMAGRERKRRVRLDSFELTGEITTEYKYGSMGGSAGGIVFFATLDWNSGSTKIDYIVRPLKDHHELLGGCWVRTPLFPIKQPKPANN